MGRVCLVVLCVMVSLFMFQRQGLAEEKIMGLQMQVINMQSEIQRLEREAGEVGEKIKVKQKNKAPAIEIKELEQEGERLRKQLDLMHKELLGVDQALAEAEAVRSKEEMYHKLDIDAMETNEKLEMLRNELIELDKVYSQEVTQGIPPEQLEEMQIRMKQLQEEIGFLESELAAINKARQ
ncbi:MAG: hypothetical protein ABIG56_05805 [Candidatus Omnitrophota bacterium]